MRLRIAIILAVLILLMSGQPANAAQVTLAWNDVTNATGYKIFMRTDGQAYNYAAPAWTGSTLTCTIPNLTNGVRYYFVARAFAAAVESINSNEVSSRYDPVTATQNFKITGIKATGADPAPDKKAGPAPFISPLGEWVFEPTDIAKDVNVTIQYGSE